MNYRDPTASAHEQSYPDQQGTTCDAATSQWDPWLVRMYLETLAALSRKAVQ